MQLQPFKRPGYGQIQATRIQIAGLRSAIADAYAWKDSMTQAEQAESATGPQVGDLHPWDALVDGCLYLDAECDDSRPYLMQYNGTWIWMCHQDEAADDWRHLLRDDGIRTSTFAYKAPMAIVIATSIDSAMKCHNAIVAHKTGGGK